MINSGSRIRPVKERLREDVVCDGYKIGIPASVESRPPRPLGYQNMNE